MPINVIEIHHHGIRIEGTQPALPPISIFTRAFLGLPPIEDGRISQAFPGFG